MTTRSLYLAGMVLGAFALAAIVAGCGSDWQNYTEKFVRSGICQPGAKGVPPWVQGRLPKSDDEIYFVGRGMGYNVLDERGAYDAAVDHVLEQLAKQTASWVSSQMREGDVRTFKPGSGNLFVLGPGKGNRFLPGEKSKQGLKAAVKTTTEALVGDLTPRDIYWEQWYVEEMPEKPMAASLRMKRYKCWVLMSISKNAMAARTAATLEALKSAAAGAGTLFASVGSHEAPPAKALDAAGASRLFRATSPHAERLGRTTTTAPPRWDEALNIPAEE